MTEQPNDLRRPTPNETELSVLEVRVGLRDGIIPPGPRARARAFADAYKGEGWAPPGRLLELRREGAFA